MTIAEWCDLEPEYTGEVKLLTEPYNYNWPGLCMLVVEAIQRRDWGFRIEDDEMAKAVVIPRYDGLYTPWFEALSSVGPRTAGLTIALLEAYGRAIRAEAAFKMEKRL